MREVEIDPIPLDRLADAAGRGPGRRGWPSTRPAPRRCSNGRTVWNVNTTATGGGVAEMLQACSPTAAAPQVDTRWLVLDGTPDFFRFTKRLHNRLHGVAGRRRPAG